MKWVKVAIGAVIAIISIGIIATSVYDMTQETVKQEVVTFEILTFDDVSKTGTVTNGTYSKINQYSNLDDEEYSVTNTTSFLYNGSELTDGVIRPSASGFYIADDTDDQPYISLISNDIIDDSNDLTIGDIFEITFEVTQPAQLTGITATLILLTPLIFAGGVLSYLLNKQEL